VNVAKERSLRLDAEFGDLKSFSGYFLDADALKRSSSGGAASAIAKSFIRNGGVVFGVAYTEDFRRARYVCAETFDDLRWLKGSKYIFADKEVEVDGKCVPVSTAVAAKLLEGRKVLFVGLACDVAGVKRYVGSRNISDDNLFTVDLICQGPTFPNVQSDFIQDLEARYRSQVMSFSVRHKRAGWTPPYVLAEFANGKRFCRPLYETDFGYAFKVFSRKSCFNCAFKGNNHPADVTLGDYWGLQPGMKAFNRWGVSIMFQHTKKGELLIAQIDRSTFCVEEADTLFAIKHNRMFYESKPKSEYYERFRDDFHKHGLHYAVVHSSGYTNYRRTALRKRILRLIGPGTKRVVKAIKDRFDMARNR